MSKNDYGPTERLMHRFALGSNMVAEMSFSFDQMFQRPDPDSVIDGSHVFISGLARAGTTALLRLYHATGKFCSLTYRNMPFPLAPCLWGRASSSFSKDGELSERAHGDGMLVGFDSPEALEEVFWRVFCGDQYIHSDRLVPMQAGQETVESFRRYIAALLETNNMQRYLSKNNNNVLRLSSIKKAFPSARILISYRDPLQQSLSLFKQHRRFCEMHRENRFSRDYMRWLVHHEFGSDHRYFDFGNRQSAHSTEEPVYWLEQWIKVYRHIMEEDKKRNMNLLYVDYEELCDNPKKVWSALAAHTAATTDLPAGFKLSKAARHSEFEVDNQIAEEYRRVHAELKKRFHRQQS